MCYMFRELKEDEIEVRIGSCNAGGVNLLLYKNARVDQSILDETVQPMNWQKSYEVVNGNLFCTVSIWDGEKKMWISKSDVGVESYAEKEKGQASDAFKRKINLFALLASLFYVFALAFLVAAFFKPIFTAPMALALFIGNVLTYFLLSTNKKRKAFLLSGAAALLGAGIEAGRGRDLPRGLRRVPRVPV